MSNGDSYNRRKISEDEFQCGCHWIKDPDWGDVLVECPIHEQATIAHVRRTDREIEKERRNKKSCRQDNTS